MISRCGPPVSWQDVSVASSEQWLSHAGHHTRLPPPAGLLRGKTIFLDESKFEYLDYDCQGTIIIAQKCPECSAGQDRRWRWRLVRTDHLGPRHLTPTGAGARVSAGSGHTLVTPPPHPGPGSCVTFALLLGTPSQFRSPINR